MTPPWHLALGSLDELQLSIALEPDGRLELHFEAASEWLELPYMRIAMVQPGRQIELLPLHAPARSVPLPRPKAPLDDLWLLVRTATRRYWFEAPYGVCGSSEEPNAPPQVGPPRPPPGAMVDDAVIPWRAIRFSLDRSDGCQLELVASSVRPGELDLEARRYEPGPPPDVALSSPCGSLQLLDPWRVLATEPEYLHVARYTFASPAESTRVYRPLVVRGAASIELALPSSLTDPAHRSVARRPAPRST